MNKVVLSDFKLLSNVEMGHCPKSNELFLSMIDIDMVNMKFPNQILFKLWCSQYIQQRRWQLDQKHNICKILYRDIIAQSYGHSSNFPLAMIKNHEVKHVETFER